MSASTTPVALVSHKSKGSSSVRTVLRLITKKYRYPLLSFGTLSIKYIRGAAGPGRYILASSYSVMIRGR